MINLFFTAAFIFVSFNGVCQRWGDYNWKKTNEGIEYHILDEGIGGKFEVNDTVYFDYIWYSEGGTPLQSTLEAPNSTLTWVVGSNKYIKGFRESILLLSLCGKGYFKIPPHLAYPESNHSLAGKTLYYYIEIKDPKKMCNN